MIASASSVEKHVKAFCTLIGTDSLLVQGAGGNVSWKDDGILWIKASGTWLAEAESKDIFVPVNLIHLQRALSKQDFYVKPEIASSSDLRPSIETLLHALMPHRVVVHLHAVEILAHLVRLNARHTLDDLIGDSCRWIFVDYCKPGADLAGAIFQELEKRPDAEVVFMANHGVVIGGENIEDMSATLQLVISKLQIQPAVAKFGNSTSIYREELLANGYVPSCDMELNALAVEDHLIRRIHQDWALYPDHVVFLGSEANILRKNVTTAEIKKVASKRPPFIFVLEDGVYENLSATPAQKAQIRCYHDVLARQASEVRLKKLSVAQIAELLNWDAEKYRQNLEKNE